MLQSSNKNMRDITAFLYERLSRDDDLEGENEMAPIRNLFNEWYSRDISKKRRISNKIRGGSGEPLGSAPYGYMKDPDNPKRWIIDDAAPGTFS